MSQYISRPTTPIHNRSATEPVPGYANIHNRRNTLPIQGWATFDWNPVLNSLCICSNGFPQSSQYYQEEYCQWDGQNWKPFLDNLDTISRSNSSNSINSIKTAQTVLDPYVWGYQKENYESNKPEQNLTKKRKHGEKGGTRRRKSKRRKRKTNRKKYGKK